MKKTLTKTILVRMTEDMHADVQKASKQKGVDQSVFIRGAIAKALPKLCACGNHWGHTGKHFIQ